MIKSKNMNYKMRNNALLQGIFDKYCIGFEEATRSSAVVASGVNRFSKTTNHKKIILSDVKKCSGGLINWKSNCGCRNCAFLKVRPKDLLIENELRLRGR